MVAEEIRKLEKIKSEIIEKNKFYECLDQFSKS
jgi:hypothetical protein